MNKKLVVQSMGYGVQSVTISAMACLGDLPMPDFAIFSDPGWESRETYEYKKWFEVWAKERGLEIRTVSRSNIREDFMSDSPRVASMPFYTKMNGQDGMLNRQCTTEYKIEPILKHLKSQLGIVPYQRISEKLVNLWLGISLDEVMRMKDSRTNWILNSWPLIEKRMTRVGCIEYLKSKQIPVPPKSSCIGCPFHSDSAWRDMKKNRPDEFSDAVDFDRGLREKRRHGIISDIYLHPSRIPLGEVDFTDHPDMFNNECEGHCGL